MTPQKKTSTKTSESTDGKSKATAIIRTGGKQYRVAAGDTIKVEALSSNVGESITFQDVLWISGMDVSAPLKGGKVVGTLLRNVKDKKVLIFKKRICKGYTKKQGHRQLRSEVRIDSIA